MQEDVRSWLEENYDLGAIDSVKSPRLYTNDVYPVKSKAGEFFLKLYHKIWRSGPEILWEIDFVDHLTKKGVPVAKIVQGRDGKELKTFTKDGDHLSAVLFQSAKGSKPTPPFSTDLYHRVGIAAATLHQQSNDFVSTHPRPPIDLKYLIDDSLLLARTINLSPEELTTLENFGSWLKDKINHYIEEELDWGPVHGDLTLDNLHITKDGDVVFYDFDSSGFGWRAMELQGWAMNTIDRPKSDAYLKGYREIRNIGDCDVKAAPYLTAAQDLWLRKGMKALSSPEVLKSQLLRVREWIDYFKTNNLP